MCSRSKRNIEFKVSLRISMIYILLGILRSKLEILQSNSVDVNKLKLKFSRKILLNFNDFYFYNIDTIIFRFIAREKS